MVSDQYDEAFEDTLEFPTERRPMDYRREIDWVTLQETCNKWVQESGIMLGNLDPSNLEHAYRLLYTWKNLFDDDVLRMPATDLVQYWIPMFTDAKPFLAKTKIYTAEENRWQKDNLTKLLDARILEYIDSLWCGATKFVRKKDKGLRMAHVFCPVNTATLQVQLLN